VPLPHRREALVEDPAQGGVQADDHRDGCGVVVGPAATPGRGLADVAAEEVEVEVPAPRPLDASLEGTVADRERRQPGCDAQALLGAGVPDVDAPLVGAQLDAADAGDRVGEQEGIALLRARGHSSYPTRRGASRTPRPSA
jgi:hypothetical protein